MARQTIFGKPYSKLTAEQRAEVDALNRAAAHEQAAMRAHARAYRLAECPRCGLTREQHQQHPEYRGVPICADGEYVSNSDFLMCEHRWAKGKADAAVCIACGDPVKVR